MPVGDDRIPFLFWSRHVHDVEYMKKNALKHLEILQKLEKHQLFRNESLKIRKWSGTCHLVCARDNLLPVDLNLPVNIEGSKSTDCMNFGNKFLLLNHTTH
jgi:hypothetical protein